MDMVLKLLKKIFAKVEIRMIHNESFYQRCSLVNKRSQWLWVLLILDIVIFRDINLIQEDEKYLQWKKTNEDWRCHLNKYLLHLKTLDNLITRSSVDNI